jgi:DNA-binding transcriptional ArsR family regulator
MGTKNGRRSRKKAAPGAPRLTATVAELRALAHPLRMRIFELFAEAPRTTKRVADLLGEPPTRLYHHVAALERAGLLKLRETRKNRGTIEKWYETSARKLGVSASRTNLAPREASAFRALATTVLDQARSEVASGFVSHHEEPPLVVRIVLGAEPERMPEFRRRVIEYFGMLQREFADEDDTAEGAEGHDRWSLTLAYAPVSPRRKPSARL